MLTGEILGPYFILIAWRHFTDIKYLTFDDDNCTCYTTLRDYIHIRQFNLLITLL